MIFSFKAMVQKEGPVLISCMQYDFLMVKFLRTNKLQLCVIDTIWHQYCHMRRNFITQQLECSNYNYFITCQIVLCIIGEIFFIASVLTYKGVCAKEKKILEYYYIVHKGLKTLAKIFAPQGFNILYFW